MATLEGQPWLVGFALSSAQQLEGRRTIYAKGTPPGGYVRKTMTRLKVKEEKNLGKKEKEIGSEFESRGQRGSKARI